MTEMTDAQKYLAALKEKQATVKPLYAAYLAAQRAWAEAETDANDTSGEMRKILAESTDPLTKWIGENTLGPYPEHSKIVLEALPATYDELQSLADERDWCADWDRLLRLAARAGVITLPQRTPEYVDYMEWHDRYYGARREVSRRLNTVLVAERKAAVAAYIAEQEAKAQAEA